VTTPPGQPPFGPGQPESPTQRIPQPYQQPPTQRIPQQPVPPAAPTERIAQQPVPPVQPTQWIPQQPVPPAQPPTQPPPPPYAEEPEAPRRGLRGDPLSVALALVIVGALALAALLGAEVYARHKADSIVAKAVSCVVQDSASASFGMRPFLLQHFTHRYRDMRVETGGNQIREAKGMTMKLRLDDVRIQQTADSAGTLGSLDADVTWSADGIKQTVQGVIPLLGGLVSGVTAAPSEGTLELDGPLGTVTIKPEAVDGTLKLNVLKVTGLGMRLPSESVQPALDVFTDRLTKDLPMGVRAESIQVTDSGVAARFGTRNATIPNGQQDPCFAGL